MKLLLTAPGISGVNWSVIFFDVVTTDPFPVHVIRTKVLQGFAAHLLNSSSTEAII